MPFWPERTAAGSVEKETCKSGGMWEMLVSKNWGSSLCTDLAWLPGMQLASIQSLPIHDGTAAVDICSPPKEEDINQAHLEQVSR